MKEYFTDEGMNLQKVSNSYVSCHEKPSSEDKLAIKMMRYSTLFQYRIYMFPQVRILKKQDECDSCIWLNIIIQHDNSTQEENLAERKKLDMHKSTAKDQRRAMYRFTKAYVSSLGCSSDIPKQFFIDHIDEPLEETSHLLKSVIVMCEDFGQGIAMTYYGYVSPGSA